MNERQILSLLKNGQVAFRHPLKLHFQPGTGEFGVSAQARGGWSLATLDSVYEDTVFELSIAGETVAGVTYEEQIATGAYAGWGFTLDEGVLKFANLA